MKFSARQYFASLLELSKDRGLIGQVLQSCPEWMIREADKWAQQTQDYRERHEDPKRLPLPDPWQVLLDAPAVSPFDRSVFRAAQSQLPALLHLTI